jgi:hypothetical protein
MKVEALKRNEFWNMFKNGLLTPSQVHVESEIIEVRLFDGCAARASATEICHGN